MPYMERKGVVKTYETNLIVIMKAVDEKLMQEFYDFPIKGEMPKKGQVIIGQGLANRIGKNIKDEITLFSPIDQVYGIGLPPIKTMEISGIFSTQILNYDDSFIFITMDDGKNLFKRKRTYDGFDIKISDDTTIEAVKSELLDIVEYNLNIKSWKEKNRSLIDAMRMERLGAIAILGLIFLVASFNLSSNLILLSIRKMKEVGIIRVIGAPKYQIISIMVHLGIKKAIKGSLAGMAIALLIVFIQNTFFFIPLPSKIYFIDFLPMELKMTDLLLVVIMVSTFIFFSSYFAAKK
jgi:ABC-type transport system, involved in lipoprotein release, permease component